MYQTALHYKSLGLSILGCRDKRPVMGSWLAYKTEIASDEDISTMFNERNADQIACICGRVSGNLEVIDVDCKNDPRKAKLFDELLYAIVDYFDSMPPAFVMTSTPSGGFHILYRVDSPVDGNKKLASLPDPTDAKKRLSIIETRGEGGYFITSPSPNYVNLSGSMETIPVISKEVRDDIHDICRTFNQVTSLTKDKPKSKILYSYKKTPWDQYNTDPDHPAIDLLQKHGWTIAKDEETQVFLRRPGSDNRWGSVYHKDTHHLYVFTSSSVFEPEKGYSPTAVLAMLEHDGDFAAACSSLRRDGYGSLFNDDEKRAMDRSASLFSEGINPADVLKMLSVEFVGIDGDGLQAVVDVAEKKTRVRKGIFWARNKAGNLRIVKPKLADFLSSRGYHLYAQSIADVDKTLVHVDLKSHVIREVPLDVMKKDLRLWIFETDFSEFEISDDEILECLYNVTAATWKDIFHWLHVLTIDTCPILRDSKYTSYVAFRNGVVKITKASVDVIGYDELDEGVLIWDTSIKDRDIFLAPITSDMDLNNSSAWLFLKRIAGLPPSHDHIGLGELAKTYTLLFNRLQAFMTTTGFLLSNYKDPERPCAVVLAEDTADEGQGGGTGKGVYVQMLSHVRNVCTLFGREWKPDSDFAYSRVRPSTDLIFLDDAPVRFDFQRLYNVITEGININRKYKDEMTIPYSLSPKFVISTNYDVNADGEHGKRRQIKVFFHKYFTADKNPKQEFGKLLFSGEWTDEEWNWYYNVMFYMVQAYYTFGVTKIDVTENMKVKQIKLRYREEFYDFMRERIHEGTILKEWTNFNDFYQEYLSDASLIERDYSRKRFRFGLNAYTDVMGLYMYDRMISYGTNKGSKEIKISRARIEEEAAPF